MGLLQLTDVTAAMTDDDVQVRDWTVTLDGGGICYVPLTRYQSGDEAIKLLLGLRPTTTGQIKIDSNRWEDLTDAEASKQRYRIGCLFNGPAWVQNLSVGENLLWPMMHQGLSQAVALARLTDTLDQWRGLQVSSADLSVWRDLVDRARAALDRRPAKLTERTLQLCQWLRCAACDPVLVLASRPSRGLPASVHPPLRSIVQSWCDRSIGVVWFDSETALIHSLKHGGRPIASMTPPDVANPAQPPPEPITPSESAS